MSVEIYLAAVRQQFASGVATEHSYRAALEALFRWAMPDVTPTNEPKRLVEVGAPDFSFNRGGIAIGWCEAKDLPIDLTKLKDANAAQKTRYLKALPNLIYTNGLDFEFYKNGERIRRIAVGTLDGGRIVAQPDEFDTLANQLRAFAAERPQSVTTAKQLAQMMAGKAVLIKDIMANALRLDAQLQTELTSQFAAFKAHLIHDIDADEFADVYAETIAYGLFAARLHDPSIDSFSRAEALELLPKSNPFLRSLFGYIAGVDLDNRIAWVIDELCEVLRACNVNELMADFGKWTARNDPFLHFYETFLAEYNPAKRKARGVWYTPEPVVNFIVRAVDDVLKTEFGLPMGLADTSKITVDWDTGQVDAKGNRTTIKKDVHRVQILDPATGTGTFLAEAIKQIAARVKGVAPGMWSDYVERDLIPRIHGFELLMASYAMCHMKIDMMLRELDYVPSAAPPRLSVYLTNSLEEGAKVARTFDFAGAIAREGRLANEIKTDMPIMCVIGNPPYSGESANKGDWIMGLMEAYKMEPGGKVRLQERNPKWINDDYVKFIRFAEHMIAKNGEGVLGFITNHGYLDNPTFRGMRWHLLKTFDKIYVLDLHGNGNKKEVGPDGSPDSNVFDILQGVAVVIALKKAGGGDKLGRIYHGDLWGRREEKYAALWDGRRPTGELETAEPSYAFVPRDQNLESQYLAGVSLSDLMRANSVGVVTARDALTIDMDKDALWKRVGDFSSLDIDSARSKYALGDDAHDWSVREAQADVLANFSPNRLVPITYRPFDQRWTYYTGTSRGFMCRPRGEMMRHLVDHPNVAIIAPKQTKEEVGALATASVSGHKSFSAYDISSIFPLYLYPEPGSLETGRRVNFDPKIYAAIRAAAGLGDISPSPLAGEGGRAEGSPGEGPGASAPDKNSALAAGSAVYSAADAADPSPARAAREVPSPARGEGLEPELRVFDYIYGVLHSPDYRATYAQFLKIDFPRIPYPASPEVFAHVADKGGQLRRLHLMEDAAVGDTPYPFMGTGDGVVVKPRFEDGRVWINADQHFDAVPPVAWDFHIGGYQPAQKWLKDRKGRSLGFDDVRHYQKIVKILTETDRIMREIVLPL